MKSLAFPVPEIIGGTQKNLDSPWIRCTVVHRAVIQSYRPTRLQCVP